MILLDANVPLYAYNAGEPRHAKARRRLENVLSGDEPIRFTWQVLLAFLRITTGQAIRPAAAAGRGDRDRRGVARATLCGRD